MEKYSIITLVLASFLAEITLGINEMLGFFMYMILIASVLIPLFKTDSLNNYSKLAIFIIIVPLVRVAELFLVFPFFWKTLIAYSIFFFLIAFYSLKFKINHGYTAKNLFLLPLVIIVAVLMGLIGNGLGLEKHPEVIFLLLLIAFSEEVLFRGLIQNLLSKQHGAVFSIFIASILYSILSLSFGFPAIIFFFISGVIIGIIYYFSENIFLTIAINLILQFFLFVLPKISL